MTVANVIQEITKLTNYVNDIETGLLQFNDTLIEPDTTMNVNASMMFDVQMMLIDYKKLLLEKSVK